MKSKNKIRLKLTTKIPGSEPGREKKIIRQGLQIIYFIPCGERPG